MTVRWEGFSHEEIYARVHAGPGRSASLGAETVWAETEAVILDIERRIAEAIGRARGGWTGLASDQALNAMTPLGQWALDAANDAKITAQAVTTQAEQAQELRNTIPEPPSPDTKAWAFLDTITNESMGSMEDLQAAESEEANRAARAVDLMNTYTNNSFENRRHMDYWTLPPQVTVETAAAPASGGAGAGTGGGFAPGDSGPVEVAAAGAPAAPGPAAPVVGPAADAPPAGNAGGVPVAAPPPVAAPDTGAGTTGRAGGTPIGGAGLPPATVPAPGTAGGARSATPPALPPTEAATPGRRRGDGQVAAVRPVIPGPPPRPAPAPGWRDVVASTPERPAPGVRAPEVRAPGEPPVASEPPPRSGVPRGGAALPGPAGLYPPMAAGLAGSAQDQEHRRPDYLIDDTDAFADDRWFPGPVITPDDVPPRRR